MYAPLGDPRSFEILDPFGNVYHVGEFSDLLRRKVTTPPEFNCPISRDVVAWELNGIPRQLLFLDAYGSIYYSEYEFDAANLRSCTTWDGRTDVYRPGEAHAVMMKPWQDSSQEVTLGLYILSRDGTTYACGNADISYTQYNQPLPENFGLGDRYAVSFALDQENGIAMLDSRGNVYTSGTLTHQGEPEFGESIATDIQLLPKSIYGLNAGYGVLATDGRLFECQSGTCDEWQNLHS